MSDISKCKGTNCPLKEKCYRYKAKESKYWQSYIVEVPYEDGKCKYFWDNGVGDPTDDTI